MGKTDYPDAFQNIGLIRVFYRIIFNPDYFYKKHALIPAF